MIYIEMISREDNELLISIQMKCSFIECCIEDLLEISPA